MEKTRAHTQSGFSVGKAAGCSGIQHFSGAYQVPSPAGHREHLGHFRLLHSPTPPQVFNEEALLCLQSQPSALKPDDPFTCKPGNQLYRWKGPTCPPAPASRRVNYNSEVREQRLGGQGANVNSQRPAQRS